MGETIVLPKSGVVLRQEGLDCALAGYVLKSGPHEFSIDPVNLAVDRWRACVALRTRSDVLGVGEYGTRDECIAWLDARLLALRAALTPPGHVLVGPDARERIARALAVLDGYVDTPDSEAWSMYVGDANAVLAALGVRGGA